MNIFGSFLLVAFLIACSNGSDRRLAILFNRVDHLNVGSAVYLNGVSVGKVTDLDLADTGVLTTIKLDRNVRVPKGSTFSISPSLLGIATIVIEPSGQSMYLNASDTCVGRYIDKKPLDILISDSSKSRKAHEALNKIRQGIQELVEASADSLKRSE